MSIDVSDIQHFSFDVVTGASIKKIIDEDFGGVTKIIEEAYLLHEDGETVNPDSYFLRFDELPNDRIIALPAYIKGRYNVAGIKWIASFPDNIEEQLPRASAVLLLNRMDTGYPFACLEASQISAARTASSAVLGAYYLNGKSNSSTPSIGFVGTGIIARNILEFFNAQNWSFDQISLYDKNPTYANAFADYSSKLCSTSANVCDSLESLVRNNKLIVLATTAPEPYITEMDWLEHNPIILNISLRDIAPDIILRSNNIVDDIGHCLKANTSPHLAEMKFGHRDFINGTLAKLIRGECSLKDNKPCIFSPFGLGVLDLALGMSIYNKAIERSENISVPNFFHEKMRWAENKSK